MGAMVANPAGVSREVLAQIEAAIAEQGTLQDVLRWGFAQTPPCMVSEVVVQDEFTHDVILSFRDGLYLVYDTT